MIKFVNPQMGLTIQLFGSKHLENFAGNFSQNEPKVDDIVKLDWAHSRLGKCYPRLNKKALLFLQKKIKNYNKVTYGMHSNMTFTMTKQDIDYFYKKFKPKWGS